MTVSTTGSRVDYLGDGVNDTFPYDFRIFADADLKVYVATVLQTLAVDYSVTDAGEESGGNVVFAAGSIPANLAAVAIVRELDITQETDYVELDKFPAETHEAALDKLTMICQQLEAYIAVLEAGITEYWTGIAPTGPWIYSSDYPTLQAADTAAYTTTKLLIIDKAWTLGANTTLTAAIKMIPGGSFSKASTFTLAFSGSFENPSNGQCFVGFSAGDVTFGAGAVEDVHPEWWGKNTTPGTTDMTSAIQASDSAISSIYGTIVLQPTTYLISGISLSARVHLKGSGKYSTVLLQSANGTMITLPSPGGETFIEISNLLLNGNNKTGSCIDINGNSYTNIHDSMITNMTTGIDLTDSGAIYTKIERVKLSGLTNGILFDTTANATRIFNNNFETITNHIKSNATFTGDDIYIAGNTFGGTGAVDFINLLSNGNSYSSYNNMAIIENNRLDPSGATSNSLIKLGQYVRASIRGNSLLSGQTNLIICDGTGVTIDDNFLADSTGAAISLTSNSTGCYIGHQKWATGARACAAKTSDVGTGNLSEEYAALPILADSATPAVPNHKIWKTGGTTTITNFTGGYYGQTITILSAHAITITDGTNIFLSGSANWTMQITDTLTLILRDDSRWYEIGRSDNT